MLKERLTQLRLSRGWSLQELATAMNNAVTKQALSKYEKGQSVPSARVISQLAKVYGVKSSYFLEEEDFSIRLIEFRKKYSLSKKEERKIENTVSLLLKERVSFLRSISHLPSDIPSYEVTNLEEAEDSAIRLRSDWCLGNDAINNLCSVIEDHDIHVLNIDASDKFDGISALIEEANSVVGAAVVSRKNIPGERQRFNIAHELGHIVQKVPNDIEEKDKEKFAHRFAGAFIAPATTLISRFGQRRQWVDPEECKLMKSEFGISIQALLRRLLDLSIITPSYYKDWCIRINQLGWRRNEPNELPFEQPTRFAATVYKAFAEEWISKNAAENFLGHEIEEDEPFGLLEKRKFARMSLKERRALLVKAADSAKEGYEEDQSWKDIQDGDIIDY